MKKLLLCLLSIASFPVLAAPSDDVSAAFGYKLRYFYEAAKDTKDPLNKINITPEAEYRFLMFTEYSLSVTPKTNKIYSINAKGEVASSCQEDTLIIEELLKRKYDFFDIEDKVDEHVTIQKDDGTIEKDRNIAKIYELNKTRIYLTCNREKNVIGISYVDNEMAIKSTEESSVIFDKGIKEKVKEFEKKEKFSIKGL